MSAVASKVGIPHLSIPDDLAELDRWVLWRMESAQGQATKVPYSVRGYKARSTYPGDWAPFERALSAWRREPQRYSGLGFVFSKTDGLVGIDIDDCLHNGRVKQWACGIVERFFDTYMEISPSGEGIKIWARGALAANIPGIKVGDGQIEMYGHARYFTVTGRVFRGAPLHVEDHADDLVALSARLAGNRRARSLQPLPGGRIPYGQQHSTLVSIVGTLRARRVCDKAIEACLQAINEMQSEKPGPRENITRIVRSSRHWGAMA